MEWKICFFLALAIFAVALVSMIVKICRKYKRGRILDPMKTLLVGVVISSVILFIPIYINTFKSSSCGVWETFLISVHNMIRLFLVDGDFQFVTDNISALAPWMFRAYSIFFAILFVLAPVGTFTFVLSFFKNLTASFRCVFSFKKPQVYIFSELNEKSLELAKSVKENARKKCLIVYTDVFEKNEEKSYEIIEMAMELGAICFKDDMVNVVDLFLRRKRKILNIFAIGEDHTENVNQALSIISKFKYRDNTHLYVFSTQVESEFLLSNALDKRESDKPFKIKLRRVNEVQSLISRTLFETGYESIFETAYENERGVKKISALIIGMGQHGTEMTKALAWFCQMDGYEAEVNAFDLSRVAETKFTSQCPELMDERLNGRYDIDGETKFKITIHTSMDVKTGAFDEEIMKLPRVTYVFVALGNDENNISTAIKLRSLFEKQGYHPKIQAIVYNSAKKEALSGITNFKGQEYDIDFIGDMKTSYSESVILDSDVEELALARHMKWGKEEDFWKYGYNYKSSIASAIHKVMKEKCGIPGINKDKSERTEEELWAIRKLEHCRWNAYMRSEGYCFASKRNDLAKTHHCLVAFDELPLEEQIKDDD